MDIKGNDSAQVWGFLIIVFNISTSVVSASSINSGVCFWLKLMSESLKRATTPRTKEANWVFFFLPPKRFYFLFAFSVLPWLYVHDHGGINDWLLPPHKQSGHISRYRYFKWFIEFLPAVEHFAFSTPAFRDILMCSVPLSALVTPVGIIENEWVAGIYNGNIPATPNIIGVYSTCPPGKLNVKNNAML